MPKAGQLLIENAFWGHFRVVRIAPDSLHPSVVALAEELLIFSEVLEQLWGSIPVSFKSGEIYGLVSRPVTTARNTVRIPAPS